jgi:PAS domain S-box-containing protein
VDDEDFMIEIAKEFLESFEDVKVDAVSSAGEAMARLKATRYDGIISDYQMPVKDGLAFLAEVREAYADMPFILFTGRGREEVVIEALNSGATFYLQKGGEPMSQFTELYHKIKEAVEKNRLQKEVIESRALMSEAESLAGMGSFSYDAATKAFTASSSMRRILADFGPETADARAAVANLDMVMNGSAEKRVRAAIANGDDRYSVEFSQASTQGEMKHFVVRNLIHRDAGGAIRIIGVFQDVTAHHKALEDMRERTKLEALFDGIDDMIWVVDSSGAILRFNANTVAATGFTESDLEGTKLDGLVSSMDGSPVSLREAFASAGGVGMVRLKVRRKDGSQMASEVRRNNGIWDRMPVDIYVARDISRIFLAESALKQSEVKFRRVFEGISDGIAIVNKEGTITDWNERMQAITGIAPEAAIGSKVWDITRDMVPGHDRRWSASSFKARIDAQFSASEELDRVHRVPSSIVEVLIGNAERKTVRATSSTLQLDDTKCLVTVVQDISEMVRAAALREAILKTTRQVNAAADIQAAAGSILDAAMAISGAEKGCICCMDEGAGAYVVQAQAGFHGQLDDEVMGYEPDHPLVQLLRQRCSWISGDDLPACVLESMRDMDVICMASVPVFFKQSLIGIMNLGSSSLRTISAESLDEVASFADYLGAFLTRVKGDEYSKMGHDQLLMFFENMPDMALITNGDGTIIRSNSTATFILGYEEDELYGMDAPILYEARQRDQFAAALHGLPKGDVRRCRIPLLPKTGKPIDAETCIRPINWQGESVCLVTIRPVA